jgi:hypothetical protein
MDMKAKKLHQLITDAIHYLIQITYRLIWRYVI